MVKGFVFEQKDEDVASFDGATCAGQRYHNAQTHAKVESHFPPNFQ